MNKFLIFTGVVVILAVIAYKAIQKNKLMAKPVRPASTGPVQVAVNAIPTMA